MFLATLTFKNIAICSGFCLPEYKNRVKKNGMFVVFFHVFVVVVVVVVVVVDLVLVLVRVLVVVVVAVVLAALA